MLPDASGGLKGGKRRKRCVKNNGDARFLSHQWKQDFVGSVVNFSRFTLSAAFFFLTTQCSLIIFEVAFKVVLEFGYAKLKFTSVLGYPTEVLVILVVEVLLIVIYTLQIVATRF